MTNWFEPNKLNSELVETDGSSTVPPVAKIELLSDSGDYPFLRKTVIELLSNDFIKTYETLKGNQRFADMGMEDKIMEIIRINRHAMRDVIRLITDEARNDL